MSEVSNRRFVHFDGTKDEFIDGGYPETYKESVVFINGDGNESDNTIYTHGEYYGQGVIVEGDASNSAIRTNINAMALSEKSISLGSSCLSGIKGYSYKHIDFDDDGKVSIFLRTDEISSSVPTKGDSNKPSIDTTIESGYEINDVIYVSDGLCFYAVSVTGVEHNKISFDASTFPFTTFNVTSGRFYVYCVDKPTIGAFNLGTNSFSAKCG